MHTKKFFLLTGAVALLTACAKDDAAINIHAVPVSDSIGSFVMEGKEWERGSLSAEAERVLLNCDTVSTEQRISGGELNSSYKYLVRQRIGAGTNSMSSKEETHGYNTSSAGAVYTRTYSLSEYKINDASALKGAAISFEEECTRSGCDVNKRKYTSGSAKYQMEVESNINKLTTQASMTQTSGCALSSGHRTKNVVQAGSYNLGGVSYKALKYISKAEGDLYCQSSALEKSTSNSSKRVYMGRAEQINISIILADKLPLVSNENQLKTNIGGTCERTKAFETIYITNSDGVYQGKAEEIVNATIKAKILTQEEHKQTVAAQTEEIRKMRDQVDLARVRKTSATVDVNDANAGLQKAKANEVTAKQELDRAKGMDANSKAAVKDGYDNLINSLQAKLDLASSEIKVAETRVQAMLSNAQLADRNMLDAEAALKRVEANAVKPLFNF